jgi:hypothetical protein
LPGLFCEGNLVCSGACAEVKILAKDIDRLAKTLKLTVGKLGVCLDWLLDVVADQEKRLQRLEEPDVKAELLKIRAAIDRIKDPEKKVRALECFSRLWALNIEDLEKGV